MSRPLARAAGLLLGLFALIFAIDATHPRGSVHANGILDERFFVAFSEAGDSFRLGHTSSRIEIPGFPARSDVDATLTLSSAPRRVRILEGDLLLQEVELEETPRPISLKAHADALGVVRLRIEDLAGKKRGIFNLVRVDLAAPPGLPPLRRLLFEAAVATLLGTLCLLEAGIAAFLVAVLVLITLLLAARFYLLAYLGPLIVLLLAGLLLAGLARRLGVLRPSSGVLVLTFMLRLGLVMLPSFPSVDLEFHAHNIDRFRAGEILKSRAPGPGRESVPVPYPPALYALLSPLVGEGDPTMSIRLAMGVLEGTAPLLVFLILRAGGALPEIAGGGAELAACLPEGILVLGKGIAANILGSWMTLVTILVIVQKARFLSIAALLTLTLLSHFGVSLSLGLVLLFLPPREGKKRLVGALALSAGLAFVLYYREVLSLSTFTLASLGTHLTNQPSAFFRVRWVRVGKTLQDLVLKFGGGSLVLAGIGWKRFPKGLLRDLVLSWLGVGLGLGIVAILTPIPLRFEYFLTAPVAIVGGYGVDYLRKSGRGGRVSVILGLGFSLTLLIGVFMLFQRFDIISVIQESDRWGFPFHWWEKVPG